MTPRTGDDAGLLRAVSHAVRPWVALQCAIDVAQAACAAVRSWDEANAGSVPVAGKTFEACATCRRRFHLSDMSCVPLCSACVSRLRATRAAQLAPPAAARAPEPTIGIPVSLIDDIDRVLKDAGHNVSGLTIGKLAYMLRPVAGQLNPPAPGEAAAPVQKLCQNCGKPGNHYLPGWPAEEEGIWKCKRNKEKLP